MVVAAFCLNFVFVPELERNQDVFAKPGACLQHAILRRQPLPLLSISRETATLYLPWQRSGHTKHVTLKHYRSLGTFAELSWPHLHHKAYTKLDALSPEVKKAVHSNGNVLQASALICDELMKHG